MTDRLTPCTTGLITGPMLLWMLPAAAVAALPLYVSIYGFA